jgi:hypothetical protein
MAPSATSPFPEQNIASKKLAPVADLLVQSGLKGPIADWHHDLIRDGYAVVKGAVPLERANQYANDMYSWLEGL